MNLDKLLETGDRCINEEPPACTSHCPLHVDVKSLAEETEKGEFVKAYKILEKKMPFPRIIGMICDHPCQSVCVRNGKGGSILIGELEKAALLYGYTKAKKAYPLPALNKKVAVIGSGFKGITACHDLVKKGFNVDLYEKDREAGKKIRDCAQKHVPSEIINEDLDFLNDKKVNIFLNAIIDADKINELSEKYQAIFIAVDDLACLYQVNEESFQIADTNMFAGKKNQESLIFSLSAGRRAALSIERYIKGVSLTASREKEGSYQTVLKYKSHDEKIQETIKKSGEIFTKQEAMEEAKRCFKCQCRDCINPCVHLKRFNIAPRSYIRNINHNERIIQGTHYANKMILSCTECGLCGKMCDYGVDMKDVIYETRESMVERNKMPQSAHDFALKDMKFSNSQKFFTYRKEPEKESIKYVFYPGCQLPASNPHYIEKVYRYLTGSIHEGVGLMLGCCGAPADWSGQKDLMNESISLIKNAWEELGKPAFILACSSCMSNFKKYMPEIDFISLWEVIDEYGLPENTPASEPIKLNIHDPCTSRNTRMQDSIRSLVQKLDHQVSELKYSKEATKCCGYGGLVYFANREQSNDFIYDRINESSEDLLVYCTMCKDLFTSKGKRTYHMLDLLFSRDLEKSSLEKMPSLSERQQNRMYVKNNLLKNIWGEEAVYEDEKYKIHIDDKTKDKMEEMFIVFDDVKKAVENSIENKERFFNPDNQSYLTRLRIENVTYWVEYSLREEGIWVINVYSHRMEVVEAKNENIR